MSMTEQQQHKTLNRWAIPGVAILAGLGYLVAGLAGDDTGFAVFGFALMVITAGLFWVSARYSETMAGLRDRTDERINEHDKTASLFAGTVVLLAVIAMFMVEIAQGRDGSPYSALGALGGVSYVAALLWLRFRR